MLLDKIHNLRKSLTMEQHEVLRSKLPVKVVLQLDQVFMSGDEGVAREQILTLRNVLRQSPLVAFKLYRALDKDQKEIVIELMESVE